MITPIPAEGDMSRFENIDGRFVEVPARMVRLKRDAKNCPIPHCTEPTDGKPRLDPNMVVDCLLQKRCWICNDKLGAHKAFLVEPVCAITRTSILPPAHLGCALFTANVRHPDGVTMIYVAKTFEVTKTSMFRMGPSEDHYFRFQSREATAEEIVASIEKVFPELLASVGENVDAQAALNALHSNLLELIQPSMKPRQVAI